MARRVRPNCPQTDSIAFFPQLLHKSPHLPNSFHILFPHPGLWLSKLLNHIPFYCLTQNHLWFPLGTQHSPAAKGRVKGSALLASCFLSFFFFIFLVGIFHDEFFPLTCSSLDAIAAGPILALSSSFRFSPRVRPGDPWIHRPAHPPPPTLGAAPGPQVHQEQKLSSISYVRSFTVLYI